MPITTGVQYKYIYIKKKSNKYTSAPSPTRYGWRTDSEYLMKTNKKDQNMQGLLNSERTIPTEVGHQQ